MFHLQWSSVHNSTPKTLRLGKFKSNVESKIRFLLHFYFISELGEVSYLSISTSQFTFLKTNNFLLSGVWGCLSMWVSRLLKQTDTREAVEYNGFPQIKHKLNQTPANLI